MPQEDGVSLAKLKVVGWCYNMIFAIFGTFRNAGSVDSKKPSLSSIFLSLLLSKFGKSSVTEKTRETAISAKLN